MKNASDGLISRLGRVEARISELEDILIEFLKNKKTKRTKTEINITEYPRTVGQLQKV